MCFIFIHINILYKHINKYVCVYINIYLNIYGNKSFREKKKKQGNRVCLGEEFLIRWSGKALLMRQHLSSDVKEGPASEDLE